VKSPDGNFLASTAILEGELGSVEVLSLPELRSVFAEAELQPGISSWSAENVGNRSGEAARGVAFFGEGQFAFVSRSKSRSSGVSLVDLRRPDEVTRLTVPGRAISLAPSLCNTTFRTVYDRLSQKNAGGMVDRYSGDRSRPWRRVIAFPPTGGNPVPDHRLIGEADCRGNLVVVKFSSLNARRHFQILHVSPQHSVKLVERVRNGYQFLPPIVDIGKDGRQLVYFEPGANLLEVVDLTRGSIVQSHSVDFESKTATRLGLAGSGDRFAVLAHLDYRRNETRNRNWDTQSIYVLDLGEQDEKTGTDTDYD
jgi:hypothetical protein